MSTEVNESVYRRWFAEVAGKRNLDVIEELIAPGYTVHVLNHPRCDMGVEEHKETIKEVHEGFSDWQERIEDCVAQGDRVVLRLTVSGTHDGTFRGVAPTGRHVELSFIGIARFEDGKIAETWTLIDSSTQLEPSPPDPALVAEAATS